MRHAEGIEDAFAIDVGEETVVEGHEEVSEKLEGSVVVVKEFARGVRGAMLCGRI